MNGRFPIRQILVAEVFLPALAEWVAQTRRGRDRRQGPDLQKRRRQRRIRQSRRSISANPAGLIAVDDDGTIIVISMALAVDPTWSGDFAPVFANLEPENRIAAWIRITQLSAEAAANYFESTS